MVIDRVIVGPMRDIVRRKIPMTTIKPKKGGIRMNQASAMTKFAAMSTECKSFILGYLTAKEEESAKKAS